MRLHVFTKVKPPIPVKRDSHPILTPLSLSLSSYSQETCNLISRREYGRNLMAFMNKIMMLCTYFNVMYGQLQSSIITLTYGMECILNYMYN